MTATDADWRMRAALDELAAIRRYVRRQNRWFRHVDAHRRNRAHTPLDPRRMPSKEAKHRAYASADRYFRLMGYRPEDRPTTFPELCVLVDEPCALWD